MGWYLYDATRGVYLAGTGTSGYGYAPATDDTDSDGDTLPDWYERMIGTNPNNANTDGDDQGDDAYEIAHGTNPRATSVTASSNATLSVFTQLE